MTPLRAKLSDELVYLGIKWTAQTHRGIHYSHDFDKAGDIHTTRVNEDPPAIIYAFGNPNLAIYKGYYGLTGRTGGKLMGNKVGKKSNATLKAPSTDFTIGPVVAPKEVLALPRAVTRQLHKCDGSEVTSFINDEESDDYIGNEAKRRSDNKLRLDMCVYYGPQEGLSTQSFPCFPH